jgi:hypothetical protein
VVGQTKREVRTLEEQCSQEEERMVYEVMIHFGESILHAIEVNRKWAAQYHALKRDEQA